MNSIWIIYWWLLLHVSSFAGGSDLYEAPQDTEKLQTSKETRGHHSVRQQGHSRGWVLWGPPNTRVTQHPNSWGWERSHHSHLWQAGTGSFMPDRWYKGGGKEPGMKRENPEPVVKKRAAHIHTVMGGSSSSNTHSPLLYTSCHKLNFFPPSPLQPRAISPLPNQQHLLSTTAPTPGELFAL